ncbi:hypothetical protein AMTR_s00029p00242010 [Amborella trichopoda]|uniref:Alkyl transferase n=1 Tax=Amborella trichopoda TaxID=13333 RepID=W1PIJ2_AMBTC|nr:hypothetical protein AMTR_s00029p00242010 [Amborella trichopoda]
MGSLQIPLPIIKDKILSAHSVKTPPFSLYPPLMVAAKDNPFRYFLLSLYPIKAIYFSYLKITIKPVLSGASFSLHTDGKQSKNGKPGASGFTCPWWKFLQSTSDTLLAEHVAMIMDGNSRWARERGLPVSAGHEAGVRAFRKVVKLSIK